MPFSDVERDLMSALRAIRRRPVLLGTQSFERLTGFILGFLNARLAPGEQDPPLLTRFSRWQRSHTGIDKEASYSQFIRFYAPEDHQAYELFFHDFELFVEGAEKGEADQRTSAQAP